MSKRPRVLRDQRKIIGHFEVVHPNAAGIDAGSENHVVSVPEDRSTEPVRTFGTFTEDLHALADWLVECGITTVAIEATGVYWIPLFEILEDRGLRPRLVDSKSIGRKGTKTDVLDCQWLRQLHTFGLLEAAFRPPAEIMALRSFVRQRRMLIEYAADHIRHIQKALELMNVKLHLIISDTVGVTGLRIIRAILDGEHSPDKLALLRDANCAASEQMFVSALTGNYRREHLFSLRQAVELFDIYQTKICECDEAIARELADMTPQQPPQLTAKPRGKRRKNQPHFDTQHMLAELAGVDLTRIKGLSESTVLTIISETGTDMSAWETGKKFASWLTLAPGTRSSGKRKHLPSKMLIRPNRAAQAFRLAAQTLERAQCALGAFFRRIKARHGRPAAIKATAHKLALIFYTMLKKKTEFRDPGVDYYEQRYRERLVKSLKKQATTLGFELVPV